MTPEELLARHEARGERELQGHLLNLLRLRNIEAIQNRFGVRTTTRPGTPDFIFAYMGVPVCWEVKFGKGKLSIEQELLHPKLRANGWRVFTLRSVEEGKMFLDGILEEKTTK